MECPCGSGCPDCGHTRRVEIDRCPLEFLEPDLWAWLTFADMLEKGLPPVAGGLLDQAWAFVQLANFAMSDKSYWKNRLQAK